MLFPASVHVTIINITLNTHHTSFSYPSILVPSFTTLVILLLSPHPYAHIPSLSHLSSFPSPSPFLSKSPPPALHFTLPHLSLGPLFVSNLVTYSSQWTINSNPHLYPLIADQSLSHTHHSAPSCFRPTPSV